MKEMVIIALVLVLGVVMPLHAQKALTLGDVPRMSIEELKQQVDNPNLTIIDVRTSHDWGDSTMKIKGAIREDASKATTWMAKYAPNRTLVFYCA
jgi:3-mercaptopyruvate sulfurtransferase SseA